MLRKLEKYEVLDEIGHGGMATVYRARDASLDRLVALKVLHPHLQRTTEARARFSREAKSVAKLRHPHILEIYDFSGESSDQTYIAAELLTGPTVKDFVVEHQQMPPEIAACVALQLAEALEEAHAKGVIHRDVKPENVLIHQDRGVKLTDFGIAHMVDTHSFTATGQILGSPGHMAPEQVEGGRCDVRSDVFSLGTVLYFCATGRLPFVGRNPHHLLKLLLDGEYPDPLRLRPEIGADLAAIMHKALRRDPADRYQSAGEMTESLRRFLSDMGIDDPDAELERYLHDPALVSQELRSKSLGRLLAIGTESAKAGDVPRAQAALSRALAIDEGNEQALELLGSLGKRRHRRSRLIAATVSVMAALLAIVAYAAWRTETDPREEPNVNPVAVDRAVPAVPALPGGDALADDARAEPALVPPAPTHDEGGDAPAEALEQSDAAFGSRDDSARASSSRWVVFKPTPSNVSISVDGSPLTAYGPDFQRVRVKPGLHTFRFVGAEGCCQDRVVRRRIPPGARDFELPVTLQFKPARLYLKGPAPADAQVEITLPGNRTLPGRIREILRIPMSSLDASVQVKVSAPGYRTHKSVVELRAGAELTQHSFDLVREQETP